MHKADSLILLRQHPVGAIEATHFSCCRDREPVCTDHPDALHLYQLFQAKG
jgi:hypothetical protein